MSCSTIKRDYYKTAGLLFVGSIFGFFTTKFSFFKFNSEINLADFATPVITTLVGLYLTTSVQKSEKDLVVGEINQIKSEMRTVYAAVTQNQVIFSETVFRFKVMSSNLSDLKPLFKACNIEDNGNIQDVHNKLLAIKRLITSRSPAAGSSQIVLTLHEQNTFLTLHNDFNIILLNLIIYVNKY